MEWGQHTSGVCLALPASLSTEVSHQGGGNYARLDYMQIGFGFFLLVHRFVYKDHLEIVRSWIAAWQRPKINSIAQRVSRLNEISIRDDETKRATHLISAAGRQASEQVFPWFCHKTSRLAPNVDVSCRGKHLPQLYLMPSSISDQWMTSSRDPRRHNIDTLLLCLSALGPWNKSFLFFLAFDVDDR